jgi:hypothetical protein
VGLGNLAHQDVPFLAMNRLGAPQKLPLSLQNHHAYLTFKVMAVDGHLLPGLEIKVEDLHIGGIVDEEPFEVLFTEFTGLVHIDFLHVILLS